MMLFRIIVNKLSQMTITTVPYKFVPINHYFIECDLTKDIRIMFKYF